MIYFQLVSSAKQLIGTNFALRARLSLGRPHCHRVRAGREKKFYEKKSIKILKEVYVLLSNVFIQAKSYHS